MKRAPRPRRGGVDTRKWKIAATVVLSVVVILLLINFVYPETYRPDKDRTEYRVSIVSSDDYILYVPLVEKDGRSTRFAESVAADNEGCEIIETEHGHALKIVGTGNREIEKTSKYIDFKETLSLQNESRYIVDDWIWLEESNQTVWIYCEGLGPASNLSLKIEFTQALRYYSGHYDINNKRYSMDAAVADGWAEYELTYYREATE